MAHATKFDTLQYVKKLKSAGLDERIAEAQAEALSEFAAQHSEELVGKDDLSIAVERLEGKLDREASKFENKLEKEVSRLENKLEKEVSKLGNKLDNLSDKIDKVYLKTSVWLGSIIIVCVGALATIIKIEF